MTKINQSSNVNLFQTKKTVDWLVNNTSVSVFDPINFTGYQRSIDDKHCTKIVDYLKTNFFMPTAIICATDSEYDEDQPLRIVDGQHRVKAFEKVKNESPERYSEIKDYEVPVVILSKVTESTEIDTFITINKTSKKVDTSLALVLKNKINKYSSAEDMSMPKAEYIAVELAQRLNFDEDKSNIWFDKILFEGNPKNTLQLISLNAFVRSTRVLLNSLARKNFIPLKWSTQEEIDECIDIGYYFITCIWTAVQSKWPELFNSSLEKRRIIQGSIGYTSITKALTEFLSQTSCDNISLFMYEAESAIKRMNIPADNWLPGNIYSKYSSEAGYGIIAKELLTSLGY